MPRRLTRPEVARRIAIRAARDARRDLTFAKLTELFAASRRTVHDAARRTVAEWLDILAAAPVPRARKPAAAPSRKALPAVSIPVPRRPGTREHAVLVPPEPEPEVEEQPSDVEAPEPGEIPEPNPGVDIPDPADPRDPLDDPVPRDKKGSKKKGDL